MRAIIGAAEPTTDAGAPGFDAANTLSATAILAGIAQGDAFALAILRLCPEFDGTVAARDEDDFEAERRLAEQDLETGHSDRTAARLVPFLAFETTAAAALTLLARACLRAGRLADAHAVIERCLHGSPLDPTALRVAGEIELARGNRKAARGHLAKAARIARKLPEHVEDMRIAQRLLLQMQFG